MELPAVSLVSVYNLLGAAGGGVMGKVQFAHLWWNEQGTDAIGPSAQAYPYWRGTRLGEHTQGLAALVSPRPRH